MGRVATIGSWQVFVQAAFDGDERGISAFVHSPADNLQEQVTLWGRETGKCGGQARRFAEHCANKLDRKLKEAGIDIPEVGKVLADLIEEHGGWNG